jgi:hypothetical protein
MVRTIVWADRNMFYRTASLRRSSLVISVAAAASLFAGASGLATDPATAGESTNRFAAQCASKKDPTDQAVCMVEAMNKDIARLKSVQRQAKAAVPCIQFLLDQVVGANKATLDELKERAGGDLNDANACTGAKIYGYPAKLKRTTAAPAFSR